MQSSSRFWFGLVLLAVLASGIGYELKTLRGPSKQQPTDSAVQPQNSTTPSNDDSELHVITAAERAATQQQPAVVHAATRTPTAPSGAEARPAASPYSRQLVSSLANVDFTHGPITAEQAQQWKAPRSAHDSNPAARATDR